MPHTITSLCPRALLLLCLTLGGGTITAHAQPSAIEYYYRVKPGYADEFIRLFKKNQYPVLKKQIEMGRILSIKAVTPRVHPNGNERWDYRVTVTFRNAKVAVSDFNSESLNKTLHPDQETFRREERRRSEILQAHWGLPVNEIDLDAK